MNTFLSILALKHLVASTPTQKWSIYVGKCIFLGGQIELTFGTLTQNSRNITKICQNDYIFGNFCLQASTCIHSYPKKFNFCRKLQLFEGDQKELTSMTRSQNIGKFNQFRQNEHIYGHFCLQASTCNHSFPKKVNFCQKLQTFEGDQKEKTSMSRSHNVRKISKIRQSEHIFGNFSFQASSCIHSYPKIINFCRKVQNFVCDQNELTLMNL